MTLVKQGLEEPVIYTTGAHLRPAKLIIEGKERWMWVVVEFEDGSFRDGDVYNPNVFCETKEELLNNSVSD